MTLLPKTTPLRSHFKLYLSGAIGIIVFIGFLIGRIAEEPSQFGLELNPLALPSGIAVVLTLSIILLTLKQGTRSEANAWFMLYSLAAFIAASGELLMRSSAQPEGSIFWGQITGLGIALTPVALFLFVLAYTQGTALRHTFVAPMLILTGTLVGFTYGNSGLIFSTEASEAIRTLTHWSTPAGPWFALDLAWIFTLFILSIALLYYFYRTSSNPLLKKQSWYFFWVFVIPFSVGAVIDGLLPLFGWQHVPALAVFVHAVTAVLVYRGVRMYHLLRIDPATLAQNILQTMREAVIVARSDLRVEFVNQEAKKLLHIPDTEQERTLDHFFPAQTWSQLRKHLQDGTALNTEIGALHAYGSEGGMIPIQVTTSTVREGKNYLAYILVITDIRQITSSYKTIEHIVEERTRELKTAQDQVRAEDRLKREFIALSSHNLGTPLSIMQSSIHLIKATDDSGQRDQLLRMLENGVRRLAEFVDEMSAISTLESGGKLDARPISLGSIVEPLIDEAQAFSSAKRLTFKANLKNTDAMIQGNQLWLRSCVRNLLDNALKFTSEGHITLTTRTTATTAQIMVHDTGIGIKKSELSLLFIKFHRATDFERYDYEGRGLGLYLTKLIVEQHGGRITVKSELGKGSTFTVHMPLLHPAPRSKLNRRD